MQISHSNSLNFSLLWEVILSFAQPSRLASFQSLHKLPNPHFDAPLAPVFSLICLSLCLPVHLLYLLLFHTLSKASSSSFLSELLIDFSFHSVLPLIFSCLCFSPTHYQLNKPSLSPSLHHKQIWPRGIHVHFFMLHLESQRLCLN